LIKLRRWIVRIVVLLVAAFSVAYLGDWIVFKLRGSPMSKVTVSQFQTVPLKGTKVEYDYLGSSDVPCPQSLFPQAGQSPCWQLRKNPNQNTSL
jgi:hypothetical protein